MTARRPRRRNAAPVAVEVRVHPLSTETRGVRVGVAALCALLAWRCACRRDVPQARAVGRVHAREKRSSAASVRANRSFPSDRTAEPKRTENHYLLMIKLAVGELHIRFSSAAWPESTQREILPWERCMYNM